MIADNAIIPPEIGADTGGHRLLADIGVYQARDSAAAEINGYPLLEAPDGQHYSIQIDEFIFLYWHGFQSFRKNFSSSLADRSILPT